MAVTVAMPSNQRQNRWYMNSSLKAHSLRTEYKTISRDAFHSRSGSTETQSTRAYMRSNSDASRAKAASATALIRHNGWS